MAANPNLAGSLSPINEPYHIYHAEAHLMSGHIERPIRQPIEAFGRVVLENTRRESLLQQSVGETSVEGLIWFRGGHTRVAGSHTKTETDFVGTSHGGWATLATAALETLNVLDMITADRVVAQVSTLHAMTNGHVPSVTFLGSRFENLKIAGYPVEIEFDLDICGEKPADDKSYLQDAGFLDRVNDQLKRTASTKGIPPKYEEKIRKELVYVEELKKGANESAKSARSGYSKLRCSLVKAIRFPVPIPGVRSFGNVIFVPNVGTVTIAELEVGSGPGASLESYRDGSQSAPGNSNYFSVTMLDMDLGSPVGANASGPGVSGNGQTKP